MKKNGFTLVELIVIILLIAVISLIFLPAFDDILKENKGRIYSIYRKNMISFENKVVLIITTLLGMLLYALEHSLAVWGIFLTMIWALPLSISYIKTKNVYVPMTAHFIGNLLGNGIDIIFTIIAMISKG